MLDWKALVAGKRGAGCEGCSASRGSLWLEVRHRMLQDAQDLNRLELVSTSLQLSMQQFEEVIVLALTSISAIFWKLMHLFLISKKCLLLLKVVETLKFTIKLLFVVCM